MPTKYCVTLPETLFSSAAHLLRNKWLLACNKKRLPFNGVPGFDFQVNVNLFSSVQSFVSQSNRFSQLRFVSFDFSVHDD